MDKEPVDVVELEHDLIQRLRLDAAEGERRSINTLAVLAARDAEIAQRDTEIARLREALEQSYRLNTELEAALKRLGGAPMRLNTAAHHSDLCSDCPPASYPNDETRCLPCPRRFAAALPAPMEDK